MLCVKAYSEAVLGGTWGAMMRTCPLDAPLASATIGLDASMFRKGVAVCLTC